jgi:non-heme chloroperoxidase
MDSAPQPASIAVHGGALAYIKRGDGDAFVFVHGSLGDYRDWLGHLGPFAERYRTILYSRRAHHPNAWPEEYTHCDPEVHAADLAAVIETLEAGPVHLFGHSYGGLISLVLAARRPDLVRTLILGEPPLMPWLEDSADGRALGADFMASAWLPARAAFQQGEMEEGVRAFINGVIGDNAFDRLPPPVRAAMMDNAAAMHVETVSPRETFFSTLTRKEVSRLRTPVLLVNGEKSPPMFALILDELEHSLPDVERVTIPGVSHELGNPPALQEAVFGFVARRG